MEDLEILAEQEGFELNTTMDSAADDVPEYGNDWLCVRPGVTIRCIEEYSYKEGGDLVTVTFTGQDEAQLLRGAAKFRESVLSCMKLPEYQKENCTVLGPAPCPVPKINYNYRYRLTLRCTLTKSLRALLAHMLRQFSQDKENRGITGFIDVNGYD